MVSGVLVRVQHGPGSDGEGLSGAEAEVVRMLRTWTGKWHLPGVALVNVNLPDRKTTRQVDALVFTPHGLLVVEVKGFTRAQPGKLVVPPNGPWTVDEAPAAIYHLTALNPGEQVKAGVYAAKKAFAEIDGGGAAFVTGLVVLVPIGKGLVLGDTGNAGVGIRVVLGTQRELRKAVHRHGRGRRPVWSASGVLDACEALALTHLAPGLEELLAEGFPEVVQAPTLERPVARPAPPAPPGAAPASRVLAPPAVPPASAPPGTAAPPARAPASASAASAPAPVPPMAESRPGTTRTRQSPPPRRAPSPPQRPAAQEPPPPPSPPRAAPPSPSTLPPLPQPTRPPVQEAPQHTPPVAQKAPRQVPERVIPWGLLVVIVIILAIGISAAVLVHQAFHGG